MERLLPICVVLAFLFSVFPASVTAQEITKGPTQTVRGIVTNAADGRPLAAVLVQLSQGDSISVFQTDSLGAYVFENIPAGRVNLSFELLGFRSASQEGVLVESGRSSIVNMSMYPQTAELQTIVVKAVDIVQLVYPVLFVDPEEVRRFPANFFDPGRFVTQYPGLTSTNDQGNAISVRGTSPAFFRWRLEGIEIVNPNHTANAGTFGDRATVGAGGVNMLSNQAMSAAQAYRVSDLPMQFDNTVGGMLDMRYRNGNNQERETTASVGLLGLEIATEGPLAKGSDASYLVHYRYSFTGLLGALGVNFGEEDIRFQDLSFNLHLPTQKLGNFGIFGIGGTSANLYETDVALEEVTDEKELQNIDFRSRTGIVGLKHKVRLGNSVNWVSRVGLSATATTREANDRFENLPLSFNDVDSLQEQLLFANTYFRWLTEGNDAITVGANFLQRNAVITAGLNRMVDSLPTYNVRSELDQQLQLVRFYGNWEKYFGNWDFALGFNGSWYPAGNEFHPGIRVSGQYTLPGDKHRLKGGYQSMAQLPPAIASSVFASNPEQEPEVFPLMKTEGLFLDYFWNWSNNTRFYAGLYHNIFYNLPQSLDPAFGFSAFNQLEQWRVYPVDIGSEGEGRTYGLEVSLHKHLAQDWYYIVSGSLYRSFYTNATGRELPSQFDRLYNATGTIGREWTLAADAERKTIIGGSFRTVVAGGLRVAPIIEDDSAALGFTNFDLSDGFTDQLNTFFRCDFQAYIAWNKTGFSQRLSIDIHNLTNQQNVAFYYFDNVAGEIRERYQLGLVPVISYRFSF
jgi:hypothetical protein